MHLLYLIVKNRYERSIWNNIDHRVILNPLTTRKDEIFPLFEHYLNIFAQKNFIIELKLIMKFRNYY